MPIGDRPMIWHILQTVIKGGADRIIVSLNGPHPELTMETITKFDLDVPIQYNYSSTTVSGGPGRDLLLLQAWVQKDEPFVLTLADAYFTATLDLRGVHAPHIWTMPIEAGDDPSKYGQVVCQGDRVTHIWEKPAEQQSDIIQAAMWKLPPDVFRIAERICAETDGEVQVGDITKHYVLEGRMTHTRIAKRSYLDCGTPSAWRAANRL